MENINDLSYDDLIKQCNTSQTNESSTVEQKFADERLKWVNKIKVMTESMKDIYKVSELMSTIYTDRQLVVEYYFYLLTILSKLSVKYRQQWAERYEFYTYKSQKRFPNEKSKELQILTDLKEIVRYRELIENHIKYMNETKNTIDNIIYGMKYKIEIEQISRGGK